MANEINLITPPGAIRGAYSKLNPQFKEIVDYYCSLDKIASSLSVPSFLQPAARGAQFLYYLQGKNLYSLDQVTENDVVRFFIRDGKPVYTASSRNRVAKFFHAVSSNYPEFINFRAWLPYIRVARKNIQYLTDEEVSAVKKACLSEETDLSYCTRAVGILLLYTGLRACDIAALSLENILWDVELIRITQHKTAVPLTLPLSTMVGNALFDYLTKERSSDSSCLFITRRGREFQSSDVICCVKKIFKSANIRQNKGDRQGTHIFRHHLATSLLKNEVAQPVISQILGHTDPVSVQAYLSADIDHLRECSLSIEEYPVDWEEVLANV